MLRKLLFLVFVPLYCCASEYAINPRYIHSAEKLVARAAQVIQEKGIVQACADFEQDATWSIPDISLLVFDDKAIPWSIAYHKNYTWHLPDLINNVLTSEDQPIITAIKNLPDQTGWIYFFRYRGDVTSGYFKTITVDSKIFYVAAILFTRNAVDMVQEMVFNAYEFYKRKGLHDVIQEINSPIGRFVKGTFAVVLYDENGVNLADSYDITHVGQSIANWKDDTGAWLWDKFKRATNNPNKFGMAKAILAGQVNETFVFQFRDEKSKKRYYLASGYYPEANEDFIISLAQEAADLLKKEGKKAFDVFNKRRGTFYKARVGVAVYDAKGVVMANTRFPLQRGTSQLAFRDQGGHPIIKDLIEMAMTKDSGWVYSYQKNVMEAMYVQKVETSAGTFIISVQGFTPVSDHSVIAARSHWINNMLLQNDTLYMLNVLNWHQDTEKLGISLWLHGDFFVELYDKNGYYIASPLDYNLLWSRADKEIISFAQHMRSKNINAGWFEYTKNGKTKYIYQQLCKKNKNEEYIIVVGYERPGKEEKS